MSLALAQGKARPPSAVTLLGGRRDEFSSGVRTIAPAGWLAG
mgnify:CR=1 FL=1